MQTHYRAFILLSAIALLFGANLVFAAERYQVDTAHTYILFKVKHFDIGYSYGLAAALQENGLPYEFYAYEGGGHNLISPYFEQAMQRTVEFFQSNLCAIHNSISVLWELPWFEVSVGVF